MSTIAAQLKGGCMHIGSRGSIRDRPLPLYHTASLALPMSSCPYVIVSMGHRIHLVNGEVILQLEVTYYGLRDGCRACWL